MHHEYYKINSSLSAFYAGDLPFLLIKFAVKRCFDLVLALLALVLLIWPMIIVALAVRLSSKGPALYWSERVGKDNRLFKMPKFRSMRTDTPAIATHLLEKPEDWLTPIGSFIRKTSLDELPQLWCILNGDMSFVGPRPALFNQYDLIELRTAQGVHKIVPGLTGWAQINGRDELTIAEKVNFDVAYLRSSHISLDIKIICRTLLQTISSQGVSH